MKTITLLLICLVGILQTTYAQHGQFASTIDQHLYYGRYAEAKAAAEKALAWWQVDRNGPSYPTALAYRGRLHFEYAEWGAADSLLQLAVEVFQRNGLAGDSMSLRARAWLLENAYRQGRLQEAATWLEQGLAQAAPANPGRVDILLQAANLEMEWSRYAAASARYTEALEAARKAYGRKHPRTSRVMNAWTRFLLSYAMDYAAASKLNAEALRLLEEKAAAYPQEYLEALLYQADLNVLYRAGYREAAQQYQQAVSLARKYLGERHPFLAKAWLLRGSYLLNYSATPRLADSLFQAAIGIYTHHFGPKAVGQIDLLRNRAVFFNTLGYTQVADSLNQQANQLTQEAYGENRFFLANLLIDLQDRSANQGNSQQAQAYLNQADSLYRAVYGAGHLRSEIKILEEQAGLWAGAGRRAEADSLYQIAQEKRGQLYGEQSPGYWGMALSRASSLGAAKKISQSDSLFQALIRFNRSYFEPGNVLEAIPMQFLAGFLEQNQVDTSRARQLYQDYDAIVVRNLGKENRFWLSCLDRQIRTAIKQRDFDRAEQTLAEHLRLAIQLYGEKSGAVVQNLNRKIELYNENRTPREKLAVQRELVNLRAELGRDQFWPWPLAILAFDYIQIAEYDTAQQIIEAALQELVPMDPDHYMRIYVHGMASMVYAYQLQFDLAQNYLDTAERLARKLDPEGKIYSIFLFNRKLEFYIIQGNDRARRALFEQELQKPENANDPTFLNRYSIVLSDLGEHNAAEAILQRALALAEPESENYAAVLTNLSFVREAQGQYAEVLKLRKEAIAIYTKLYGETHPKLAPALNNLASIYEFMDRFEEAESIRKRILSLIAKELGKTHLDYGRYLNNIGYLYVNIGQFKEAEACYVEALDIYTKRLGTDHPEYFTLLSNLAYLYLTTDRIALAEEYFRRKLDFWHKRQPGGEEYATALRGMGDYYEKIGAYEQARRHYEESLEILIRLYGEQSRQAGLAFNRLGILEKNESNYQKADLLFTKALNINLRLLGENHSEVAVILSNRSLALRNLGRYAEAEADLQKAIQIHESLNASLPVNLAYSLESYAAVLQATSRLPEAEATIRRCLELQREIVGKNHEDYAYPLQRLGRILLQQGHNTEADSALAQAFEVFTQRIRQSFSYLPLLQQKSFLKKYRILDYYPTAATATPSPVIAGLSYDVALLRKGAILHNSRSLRERLEAGQDTSLLALYDQYQYTTRAVSGQYKLPKDRRTALDSLQQRAEALEAQLLRRSPEYQDYIKGFQLSWQDIQATLQPGEAAIEFIRYNRHAVDPTDTFYYAAAVLRPGWDAPQVVPLCAEAALEQLLRDDPDQRRKKDYVDNIYGHEARGAEPGNKPRNLFQLLWEPLEPMLAGAKHIYFSPDGLLHRINFNALAVDDQQRLLDRPYALTQLRSTRYLADKKTEQVYSQNTALIYGGIDFDQVADAGADGVVARGGDYYWSNLPHANKEVGVVTEQLKGKRFTFITRSGQSATEEAFMQDLSTVPSPRVLHVITHAYFAPNPSKYEPSDRLRPNAFEPNPMMRSALVFAGANRPDTLRQRATGEGDRIVTAQEISPSDLSGTELVVLSACETGLGDIDGAEGVYGLQRAFLQAGAKQVLVSLWEVDDETTAEWMEVFYREWLQNGKSPRQALRATQQIIREKYPKDPYYWAAFVLVE